MTPEFEMTKESILTIVFDTANWSDEQLRQMTHREDAKALSWSHALHDRDRYMKRVEELRHEIERLKWAAEEHD